MKFLKNLFVLSLIIAGALLLGPIDAQAQTCNVSISIATTGSSSSTCFVPTNQRAYVALTGTWAGTVTVEFSEDGAATYRPAEASTANTTFALVPKNRDVVYRVTFTSRTSGTLTGSIIYNLNTTSRLKYETMSIGSVAYGSFGISVIGSTTSSGVADLYVGAQFFSTGAGLLVGATGGTDKFVIGLYDATGLLIANTDTAGTTASASTNAFQEIAWTTPITLQPGRYALLVQINGTTATFRRPSSLTFVNVATSSVTSTTFGTLPGVIVMPTSMATSIAAGGTNAIGPIGYVY